MNDRYISLKYDIQPNTKANYNYTYDHFDRNTIGKRLVSSIRYSDEKGFIVIGGLFCGMGRPLKKEEIILIPDNVTAIIPFAFKEEKSGYIKKIVLPEGLTEINENAFSELKRLEEVVLPSSMRKIGKKAFYNTGLKTLSLPEKLEKVGESAFAETFIKEVHIPESVEEIGHSAFSKCAYLRDQYIPGHKIKFGKNIFGTPSELYARYEFFGNKPMVYIHTPAGSTAEEAVQQYDIVQIVHDNKKQKVYLMNTEAEKLANDILNLSRNKLLSDIEWAAFYECKNLPSLVIPDTVESIAENYYGSFYGCKKLVLLVKAGSYGEQYAKTNNIPYAIA